MGSNAKTGSAAKIKMESFDDLFGGSATQENGIECNAALYSRRKKHFIFDSINTSTALSFR